MVEKYTQDTGKNSVTSQTWVNRLGDNSAQRTLTPVQKAILWTALVALLVMLALTPVSTIRGILGFFILVYLGNICFKSWLIVQSLKKGSMVTFSKERLTQLANSLEELPIYSLMVSLRGEERVVETLIKNLSALIYPRDKLQILLLVDEDDTKTQAAIEKNHPPERFELHRVPIMKDGLHTKPHALNYGLERARGTYTGLYDAEDAPDPDQLLKVVSTFLESEDDKLACVQALLAFRNAGKNYLSKLSGIEYTNFFRLVLPGLSRNKLPVPLGGTSNHFSTLVLKRLLGWDRYNVTEDCDLGIRIARSGLTTKVIDSMTWEESHTKIFGKGFWFNQRSRWLKGYTQTWWVHMRNPYRLWRDLGTKNFLSFQLTIGATWLTALVNPLFWLSTLIYWGSKIFGMTIVTTFYDSLYLTPILYAGVLCLLIGNPLILYFQLIATRLSGRFQDAEIALVGSWPHWALMSFAGWKGQLQLLRSGMASFWEKSQHGLDEESEVVIDAHDRFNSHKS